MHGISCASVEHYIFPKDIRQAYYLGVVSIIPLVSIIAVLYYAAFTQQTAQTLIFIIGVLLTVLALVIAVVWVKNFKTITAKFEISDNTIENRIGTHKVSIVLSKQVFYKQVTQEFYIGKGKVVAKFWIVSEKPIASSFTRAGNVYRNAKSIWKSNCVLIPERTKGSI